MRIGLVCPYNINKHGGVLGVVTALKDGLKKNGHHVKIITPTPRGHDVNETIDDTIFIGTSTDFHSPSHTTTQVSSTADAERIDKILREEKFDILHFHEPWVPLLSRQLAQRSSSINIATFHAKVPETLMTRTLAKVVNPYFKSVMKYLDLLTAVSESGAEYAASMTDKPITIIPNGIDLSKYAKNSQKNRQDTILYIGRLEKRKGVKYLLQAFQIFQQDNPDTKLIIAGDGPEREKLELLTDDLKLKNVDFLGYIDEELKMELLGSTKLLVSPAIYGESFGIVLLEAMASGTVAVAGNNSGYADLMQDSGSLSLVNPQDIGEFARRLDTLYNQEDIRALWSGWAKQYVKQFDYPQVVKQYEDYYKEALKQYGHH